MRWLRIQNDTELSAKSCGIDYKCSTSQEKGSVKKKQGRQRWLYGKGGLGFANQL